MRYVFYPGCSAESSALEYKTSTLTVLEALGAEVKELEDWTCCGASVASTMSEAVRRMLSLSWGISAVRVSGARSTDEVLSRASGAARKSGLCESGDTIVIAAGVPTGVEGTTNLIKVATL